MALPGKYLYIDDKTFRVVSTTPTWLVAHLVHPHSNAGQRWCRRCVMDGIRAGDILVFSGFDDIFVKKRRPPNAPEAWVQDYRLILDEISLN